MATSPLPFLFFSVLDPSWHEAQVISRLWQCPGKGAAAAVSNACLLILHKPLPPLGAEKLAEQGQGAWRAEVEALVPLGLRSPCEGGSGTTSPAALPTLPLHPSPLPYLFPLDSQCLKILLHFLSVLF